MKPAITQLCLDGMSLRQAAEHAKKCGYEGLELRFFDGKDPDYRGSDAELDEAAKLVRGMGLEIPSIVAWGADRGNLLSPKAEERRKLEECISRAMHIARRIGVDGILLHPGQLTPEGTYDDAWRWALESLRRAAVEAEKLRVCICVENVWNRFLLNGREFRIFLDEIGSPYVACYLDTGNMIMYGFAEQWIRELGRRVKKVHVKDFKRSERKFVGLGEGDVNWPAVVAELKRIGFEGCLTQEVGGPPETHADTATRIRKIIAMGG